jgi:lysophospholipase L1-like esterase
MYAVAPTRTRLNFTVLGDSAAFGTGDADESGNCRGWAWYLAQHFRGSVEYKNYSRPGAQSTEVLETQLPQALATTPDICAVIAGGNDLLRNGFSPTVLYANLKATCEKLISHGTEIVMIELHDPTQLLRLPRLLKRVLTRRVNAVNDVYYKVANEFDIVFIRTRNIPNVHCKTNWYVDRMHPGPKGHRLLARQMAEQLKMRGWSLDLPTVNTPSELTPSKSANIKWLIRNGAPWFLKRSVDLLPAALFLMACEAVRVLFEALFRRSVH